MLEPNHARLSLAHQCALLALPRSTAYYRSRRDDTLDLELMGLLDQQYLETPFYGVRRFADWLCDQGYPVGFKRVRRLMRTLGIEAIYPKPRLSRPAPDHRIYPYLLRELAIERPNQVWCADITYIRMWRGFAYLVAVMDWFSRYVLSWRLSNTLDTAFCVEALDEALDAGTPEIFNTDQGSQFTGEAFTGLLENHGVRISMDGKGSYNDNLFIERLWRTVKYEEVYLKAYQNGRDARISLGDYFRFYNTERPHQALGYRTPAEVFASILVEVTSGNVLESLAPYPLRTAEPNLNIAPVLS